MITNRLKSTKLIIIIMLILVEMTTIFLMYKSFLNRVINTNIEKNSDNVFAILIEQEDGEYKELSQSSWPKDYEFNYDLSVCVDINGKELANVLSYDSVSGEAILATKKTSFCYLYFDLPKPAYAIYSDTDKSLTFVKSREPIKKGDTYNGKIVTEVYSNIITSGTYVPGQWNTYKSQILKVEVLDRIAPINMENWFNNLTNVQSMDLRKLDVSGVTSFSNLFYNVGSNNESGTIIDISNWDTSNVTNMRSAFRQAHFSNDIDISDWNVSNVTIMSEMFYDASINKGELDLSNWNVSSATKMDHMFFMYCSDETNCDVDLSGWNVTNVTNMSYMFGYFAEKSSSIKLEMSNWNMKNVENMSSMFYRMGYNSTAAWNMDLSGWNVSSATDMSQMFHMAAPNAEIWTLNLSNWNVSNVTNMYRMFYESGKNSSSWTLSGLEEWNTGKVTNMSQMFNDAGSSARNFQLNLSGWDVSNVSNMYQMFYRAGSGAQTWLLTGLDGWNTSKVTNMSQMFQSAGSSAESFSLDLSGWNVSNVTNMSWMFLSAGKYADTWSLIGLKNWNPTNVLNMSSMFESSGSAANEFQLDLSAWDVSNVTNMSSMFYNAGNKAKVWIIGDITKWKTGKVTDMSSMFYQIGSNTGSTLLDLSGWDVSSVTKHNNFNYGSTNKIIAPIW